MFKDRERLLMYLRIARRQLEDRFSIETSWNNIKGSTPSTGHCAVVAVILHKKFGGSLVSAIVQNTSHWFNRIDLQNSEVVDFDLTGDQFGFDTIRIANEGELFPNTEVRSMRNVTQETIQRALILAAKTRVLFSDDLVKELSNIISELKSTQEELEEWREAGRTIGIEATTVPRKSLCNIVFGLEHRIEQMEEKIKPFVHAAFKTDWVNRFPQEFLTREQWKDLESIFDIEYSAENYIRKLCTENLLTFSQIFIMVRVARIFTENEIACCLNKMLFRGEMKLNEYNYCNIVQEKNTEHYDEEYLIDKFYQLKEEWENDTSFSSRIVTEHQAYQRIIAMGKDVVSIILRDLKIDPHWWFDALSQITGENPMLKEHAGYLNLIAQDWLDWANKNGIKY